MTDVNDHEFSHNGWVLVPDVQYQQPNMSATETATSVIESVPDPVPVHAPEPSAACPCDVPTKKENVASTSDKDFGTSLAPWEPDLLVSVMRLKSVFIDLIGENEHLIEALYWTVPQWANFSISDEFWVANRVQDVEAGSRISVGKGNTAGNKWRLIDLIWLSRVGYDHAVVLEPFVHEALQAMCKEEGMDGLYDF